MPELSPAARGAAHGALPKGRPGWWACYLCSPRRRHPSLTPAAEWRYHHARFHTWSTR